LSRFDQAQPFADAALADRVGDAVGDVDEVHPGRDAEGQVFGVGFHLLARLVLIAPGSFLPL
jgi:hypothetical protein